MMNKVHGYGRLDYLAAAHDGLPFYYAPASGDQVVCAQMVLKHLPPPLLLHVSTLSREDLTIERDGGGYRIVEVSQKYNGCLAREVPAAEMRIPAEFRFALWEMLNLYKELGSISYRYLGDRREIRLFLSGASSEAMIAEPCNFARVFADKLGAAIYNNPVSRIFTEVFLLAVRHLGYPPGSQYHSKFDQVMQNESPASYRFDTFTSLPGLKFCHEPGKFWFDCPAEYLSGTRADKFAAANEKLPPLVQAYEGMRWIIDGKVKD
ncbi:MAG: hypothetical protein WCG99_02255 [Candidatus Berkelbacteria bacterium]